MNTLSFYLSKITKYFNDKFTGNTLITGGHFIYNKYDLINDGTILSFEIAANLYKQMNKSSLGILINDINSPFRTESDYFNDSLFPEKYKNYTSNLSILPESVILLTEKSSRNKGKKDMLKNYSQLNILTQGDNKLIEVGGDKIVLTRALNKDKYGTPACPLIMSGLETKKKNLGFDSSINIYYIGNDNLEVIPNYQVIEKAKKVKDAFGTKINTYNFYFNEESIFTYE